MSLIVAVIKSIVGQVFAVSADGFKRQVFEGEKLLAGEQLITEAGGSATLQLANGETTQVGANSTWQTTSATDEATADSGDNKSTDLEQALAAGFDPTAELEATAAGPSAGGGSGGAAGGGHSFVMLNETGEQLNPTVGFETAGLSFDGSPLEEEQEPLIQTADNGDNDGTGETTQPNRAPAAQNDSFTVNEDGTITIDVLSNDSDLDNDALTVSQVNGQAISEGGSVNVSNGSVTLTNGQLVFTPNANYHGPASFTYTITDGVLSSTATVSGTVTAVNDAPVSGNQNLTTDEDTPITGQIVASDVDGDTLAYNVSGNPANGTVTLNPATGGFVYTPNSNYNGSDSFVVTISDGNGGTTTSTITVGVTPDNDAPVSGDQSLTTNEDTPITGQIVASDVDGDTLAYNVSGNPANGTVTLNPATGGFVYTPNSNYNGSDSFVVTISDGNGGTTTSTITVGVTPDNDAPVSGDQSLTTNEDTPITGQIVASDVDGDTLAYNVSGNPTNGTVVLNPATGGFTYTPNTDYNGSDSFIVTISDGNGGTTTSTITVGVTPVNDAPVGVNDSITVVEDTPFTGNLLTNDTDVDGDVLTVTQFNLTALPAFTFAAGSTATIPFIGQLTVASDGTFTFTPGANYTGGVPEFTYTLSDGSQTSTATLNISITPVNDAPVNYVPGAQSVNEDGSLAFNGGRKISVGDVDNFNLSTTLSVEHGVLTLGNFPGVTVTGSGTGSVTLSGNQISINLALNGLRYTPAADYNGADQLTIVTSDGSLTDTDTVAIAVNPINDAPTNSPVTLTPIVEDSGGRLITQAELLSNASDIDSPLLTASNLTISSGNGTLVDNGNGTWTYTPAANDDTQVSFNYTVSDGSASVPGSASLDITPVNDAPTAVNDSFVVIEDTPFTGNLLANDSDIEGDALTVTGFHLSALPAFTFAAGSTATIPFIGQLTVASDGTFTFTPNANYTGGIPEFTYTLSDGSLTSTATLNLSITPVNDAPVNTVPGAQSVNEDGSLAFNGGRKISVGDVDNFSLSTTLSVEHGVLNLGNFPGVTITGSGTGSVTLSGNLVSINLALNGLRYVPNANYNGPDQLTVTTTDGSLTDVDTVAITVNPINDAPTLTITLVNNFTEDAASNAVG
ncbi:retention module-containing protein, partial [Pseudomonas sp. Gutcm_11s]|uniref:retention module-containing protein n=1 Tax=Pseudomonas sp. Gutcm_11s TaxID=3026088 RepID=UPI00235E09A6